MPSASWANDKPLVHSLFAVAAVRETQNPEGPLFGTGSHALPAVRIRVPDRTNQVCLRRNQIIHLSACVELPDATHVPLERDVQDQLVTRFCHARET